MVFSCEIRKFFKNTYVMLRTMSCFVTFHKFVGFSCLTCSCAFSALCLTCSPAFCSYVLSCLTRLVPYVFSLAYLLVPSVLLNLMCLVSYVFSRPTSFFCFRCLKPNILLCISVLLRKSRCSDFFLEF